MTDFGAIQLQTRRCGYLRGDLTQRRPRFEDQRQQASDIAGVVEGSVGTAVERQLVLVEHAGQASAALQFEPRGVGLLEIDVPLAEWHSQSRQNCLRSKSPHEQKTASGQSLNHVTRVAIASEYEGTASASDCSMSVSSRQNGVSVECRCGRTNV